MSPHPIDFEGTIWPTAEACFQAMRFGSQDPVREEIRRMPSPMHAKWHAKANFHRIVVVPLSSEDQKMMMRILGLKVSQHADVLRVLESTEERTIIEDCTSRQRGAALFWGSALINGQWIGRNALGVMWMKHRSLLKGK